MASPPCTGPAERAALLWLRCWSCGGHESMWWTVGMTPHCTWQPVMDTVILYRRYIWSSLCPLYHIHAWNSVTGTITYYRKCVFLPYVSQYPSLIWDWLYLSASFVLSGSGDQLLQYKADINAVNEHGNVPLHYACFWGQDQVAEVSTTGPWMGGKQSVSLSGKFWNPQPILWALASARHRICTASEFVVGCDCQGGSRGPHHNHLFILGLGG